MWTAISRTRRQAAGIAYNAALKLCTILLYAEGLNPAKGAMAHSRTLNAMPYILGAHRRGDADYLEACRQKRNTVEYDCAGGASRADAGELIAFGHELRKEVLAWLREKHPVLAPERQVTQEIYRRLVPHCCGPVSTFSPLDGRPLRNNLRCRQRPWICGIQEMPAADN